MKFVHPVIAAAIALSPLIVTSIYLGIDPSIVNALCFIGGCLGMAYAIKFKVVKL